jgi:hypothetical protein
LGQLLQKLLLLPVKALALCAGGSPGMQETSG